MPSGSEMPIERRPAAGLLRPVVDWIADCGAVMIDWVVGLGNISLFALRIARWLLTRLPRRETLVPNFYQIGVLSLPVVALTGTFIGMVLVAQSYVQFRDLHMESKIGAVINMSLVRELGPVLAATMLAGRVGSSMAAELGTMRVTEQLDAMRVMGADPIAHLVVPRVVACVLMIPVLTVFSDLTGVYGGYLITVRGFGVSHDSYWEFSEFFVTNYDIFTGLAKSVVFGLIIGLVSCYKGFHCAPGAAGVGRAATDAFVTSFVGIIVANFFLAKFLNDIYTVIYGPELRSPFG